MKKFWTKAKKKIYPALCAAAATVATLPMAVSADTSVDDITIKSDLDITGIFGKILGFILLAAQLVGGGILIWGIVQFALTFQPDGNPDQRSRSIMTMISGLLLICIKWVLQVIGVIG